MDYMWYDEVSADTKCGSSCTLAIWVLKQSLYHNLFASLSFLYARYMGIETYTFEHCELCIMVLVRSLYGY